MSELQALRQQLKRLSLHTMADILEEEVAKAVKAQMGYSARTTSCGSPCRRRMS